ncbi:MAG: DUF5655 domain-containing protein, partial [Candidatus Parvarchaeota archaeon]
VHNSLIDVFFELKVKPTNPRLLDLKRGWWANCEVKLKKPEDVDKELLDWLKESYEIHGNK